MMTFWQRTSLMNFVKSKAQIRSLIFLVWFSWLRQQISLIQREPFAAQNQGYLRLLLLKTVLNCFIEIPIHSGRNCTVIGSCKNDSCHSQNLTGFFLWKKNKIKSKSCGVQLNQSIGWQERQMENCKRYPLAQFLR